MNARVVFNSRPCGRCGGTGSYNMSVAGAASKGVCYGCQGAGRLMSPTTRRNALAFAEWRDSQRPTLEMVREVIASGRFGRAVRVEAA